MTEVLIIIGVVHAAVLGYIVHSRMKKPAVQQTGKVAAKTAERRAPAKIDLTRPYLQVEGAVKPANGDTRFLKLFGLGSRPVLDICYIPGPCELKDLAPVVADHLTKAYLRGDAVGSDVMEFLQHGKPITKSQQLWFALLGMGEKEEPRFAAFVDIVRHTPGVARPLV